MNQALQMPPSQSYWHLAMVNLTMFFNVAINGEPLGHVYLSFCRQNSKDSRKLLCSEHLGKEICIKVPTFTDLLLDLCAGVVTLHSMMAGSGEASLSMRRNWMMIISFQSIWVLASFPWQILDPTEWFPIFHLYFQD